MNAYIVTLRQLATMFLLMSIGFILYRTHTISDEGSHTIAHILVKLVMPAIILVNLCTGYTTEKLIQLGISAAASVLILVVSFLVSKLVFRNDPIESFAATFSNAGFMGVPLIQATLGDEAVLFLVSFLAVFNLMQWTFGKRQLETNPKPITVKSLLINPFMIAIVVGMILFVTGLGDRLPSVFKTALDGVYALNTPLSMILLGTYIAKAKDLHFLKNKRIYLTCLIRHICIPLVTLILLWPLPIDPFIKQTLLVVMAAPVGANVAIYAQLGGKNYTYASELVVVSTLLCILTLPVVAMIGSMIFPG